MSRLWAHLVYTTYLDNCIVPACFSPLVLTLTLVSYTVFIAFQWFSRVFFSSVIHLACVCIDYLYLCYTYLQFMVISEFSFALYIKFNLAISMFSQKCTHLLFSVFYYESLALNIINCDHFCLYSWHETYKNCVPIIFLYIMLHIFYYSGILYSVFTANTIISVLQVYCVVPV